MKKWLVVVGFIFVVGMGQAEASFGQSLGTAWGYIFAPVNAATQLVGDLISCGTSSVVHFIQTVISNANPSNIIP